MAFEPDTQTLDEGDEDDADDKAAQSDEDLIQDAVERFGVAQDVWSENHREALDDLRFARLEEQWPEDIRRDRDLDGRPCLTLNQLHSFIFQVVNDARQNKPGIEVHPVDSAADPETAEIFNGLIRHIEQSSDAEVAYDTAMDFAVSCGFGYWRVNTRYSCDDTFEQDLAIERIPNPLAVFPDPNSTAADSSDWNECTLIDEIPAKAFKKRWPKKEPVSFDGDTYTERRVVSDEEMVRIAERWTREEVPRTITVISAADPDAAQMNPDMHAIVMALMPDTMVVGMDVYTANKEIFDILGMKPTGKTRDVMSYKVTQRIMSGADVLETVDWAGEFIPIVPVWGEELTVEGRRILRSLIRGAKDAQRMFNYWRPLALTTPIPTPEGWTTMGAIRAGDHVFDETGAVCNVVGKSPVHINRKCYRVEFDDGSHIDADAAHPWAVEERAGRTSAGFRWVDHQVTTEELVAKKHFIPLAKPIAANDADLPVDPYVLGLWLGDGHTMGGRITPGDEDLAEIVKNIEARGYRCGAPSTSGGTRHGTFTVWGLQSALRAAGVLGFKHIPANYLRASEAQRWALLRGLMDSDGSIGRASDACGFTTTSEALTTGFGELLRTLGIKAKSVYREGRASMLVGESSNRLLPSRQFYFHAYADEPVFGLTRKTALLGQRSEQRRRTKRHGIISVSRISSVPVQCIAVDAPSHLFLAGEGMVPTHNTTATELVALAPKAPFIGRKGAFETDAAKWATANTQSHAYIEYDGQEAPERQPFAGVPAGSVQQAMAAQQDIMSIIGIYKSSLGAQSNETSGVAINARDKQADTGSFHFTDNLARAIRHCGRILLDLIPKVYSTPRMLRILGPDGQPSIVPVNQPTQVPQMGPNGQQVSGPVMGPNGQPQTDASGQMMTELKSISKVFDLTVGKYDLVVKSGPSFATRREELVSMLMELIRSAPQLAPIVMDLIVKNFDIPDADEIVARIERMMPQQLDGADAPEIAQGKQLIMQLNQKLQLATLMIAKLKADKSYDAGKLAIDAFEAQTDRIEAIVPDGMPQTPQELQAIVLASVKGILADPEQMAALSAQTDPLAAGTGAPPTPPAPIPLAGGAGGQPPQPPAPVAAPAAMPPPNNQNTPAALPEPNNGPDALAIKPR